MNSKIVKNHTIEFNSYPRLMKVVGSDADDENGTIILFTTSRTGVVISTELVEATNPAHSIGFDSTTWYMEYMEPYDGGVLLSN